MPHITNSYVLPNQNGDNWNGHGLVKKPLDAINNPQTSPSTELAAAKPIDDHSSYATQELLDALPRVWTRGLLYLLVAFAAVILPWAMLSKVDETGTARGRLEPKGATLRLDAPVAGTVAAVRVKEGQTVKAGQVLMQLESNLLHTELQQSQTQLEGQLNRLTQLELIENQLMIAIQAQQQQNQAQALEKAAQVDQAHQSLSSSNITYPLQKVEQLAQVAQVQQNLSAAKIAYALANSRFAKDQVEVERYRKLAQEGIVPKVKVYEVERLADESRRLRAQAQSDIHQAGLRLKEQQSSYQSTLQQAQSGIQQAELRLKEQQGSYRGLNYAGELAVLKSEEQLKDLKTQIATLQAEISQSKSQIKSLQFQLGQRVLRAPVSGTIFQLPITKAKAVVQPGQLIAQIAPQGSTLVLRAEMPSQESGFLHLGLPAKLKFDAYPFQDYGVVQGRLSWISPDSKIIQTAQGQIETFELEINLAQLHIQTPNKLIALTPGQTATAEVVVRQRRVIDFILDPFKKLQKGGLKL